MDNIETVINGLKTCIHHHREMDGCNDDNVGCPYEDDGLECWVNLDIDALDLIKKQQKEIKLLLDERQFERNHIIVWLSKFCRHIDIGDKWPTDEENLEFFKKKMKRQFGWDYTME